MQTKAISEHKQNKDVNKGYKIIYTKQGCKQRL